MIFNYVHGPLGGYVRAESAAPVGPGTDGNTELKVGPAKVPAELAQGATTILGAVLWVVFALGVLGLLRSAAEVQIAWKDGQALGYGVIIRLAGIVVAISAAPIVQFVRFG
jgi:hypothetical protein